LESEVAGDTTQFSDAVDGASWHPPLAGGVEAERYKGVAAAVRPSVFREPGAQGLQVAVRVRVVLRRRRGLARRCWLVDAGVLAVVDDVVQLRVLVGALHLLRRRAPLRVAVLAAVVAPAEFARRRSATVPKRRYFDCEFVARL